MVGRLKPGVTVAQAQDDARRWPAQIMRRLSARLIELPHQARGLSAARNHGRTMPVRCCASFFSPWPWCCSSRAQTLAGLLLVRAIRRQRETAVRLALGAPARTLLGQTILESLVISVTGGVLGIGLAGLALAIGRNFLPDNLPLTNQITLNWTVAGFALLLALLTGVLCGLAPGFAALRTNVNASLKEGARSGSASGAHARLRSALVVAEIAIALVLLCASGLLLRSYMKMSDVDLGFQPDHVTTAAYALPQKEYPTQARVDAFNNQVLLRLGQLPGVQSVGLTDTFPYERRRLALCRGRLRGSARSQPDGRSTPEVIGDFFKTMGIPLIRGRYFTDSDNANGQLVVIVNHEFAEHYWPNQNPIGKRLRYGTPKSPTPWMTVVGEVADANVQARQRRDRERFYQPVAQVEKDSWFLRNAYRPERQRRLHRRALRAAAGADGERSCARWSAPSIRNCRSARCKPWTRCVAERSARAASTRSSSPASPSPRFCWPCSASTASSPFPSHPACRRWRIRMALGSQRSDIVRLVLASGLKLAVVGCVLGLAGAAAASSVLRSFLFHVSPFDPVVMALTAIAVLVLAVAASALPALRAASVDPIQALRGE